MFAWNRMKICYPLENAICIKIDFKPPKMTPIFPKSKIIQKPQFPPTLLANFWYLTITKVVSDGKWQYLGLSPLWKIFFILAHCAFLNSKMSKSQKNGKIAIHRVQVSSSFKLSGTQWAKMKKVFQRGESPKFAHFPSETHVLMLKYQKLEKSVGGNWGFWINFDFTKPRIHFES